jgi:hypothetical protein
MAGAAAKRKINGNTSDDDKCKRSKHLKTDNTATPRRSARVVPAKPPADLMTIPTGRSGRPGVCKAKPTFHRFMDLPQELRNMVYDELWQQTLNMMISLGNSQWVKLNYGPYVRRELGGRTRLAAMKLSDWQKEAEATKKAQEKAWRKLRAPRWLRANKTILAEGLKQLFIKAS